MSGKTLSGKSKLVANDHYTIYLHEPAGYEMKSFNCKGESLDSNRRMGEIREITITAITKVTVDWTVDYK